MLTSAYLSIGKKGVAYGREVRERIIELHRKGVSTREISKNLLVNRKTVAKFIDRLNSKEDTALMPKDRGGIRMSTTKLRRDEKVKLIQVALTSDLSIDEIVKYINYIDPTFPADLHPSTYLRALRSVGLKRRTTKIRDPASTKGEARMAEYYEFQKLQEEDSRLEKLSHGHIPTLNADNLLFIDETNVRLVEQKYRRTKWAFEDDKVFNLETKGQTSKLNVIICGGLLFNPKDDFKNFLPVEETEAEQQFRKDAYKKLTDFVSDYGVSVGDKNEEQEEYSLPPFPTFSELCENLRYSKFVSWCIKKPQRENESISLFYDKTPRKASEVGRLNVAEMEKILKNNVSANQERSLMNFLYLNGVEEREVKENGELEEHRAEVSELKRRVLKVISGNWDGLPRRFFGNRRYKGGGIKDFIGDSHSFVKFVEFTCYCVHAFFGADVLSSVRLAWDNAPEHYSVKTDEMVGSYLHNYARVIFGAGGVVFIPPNAPSKNPAESYINYLKRSLATFTPPPIGKFTSDQMAKNVQTVLKSFRPTHIMSWTRACCYNYRSRYALRFDGDVLTVEDAENNLTFIDKKGNTLSTLPRKAYCLSSQVQPSAETEEILRLEDDMIVQRIKLDSFLDDPAVLEGVSVFYSQAVEQLVKLNPQYKISFDQISEVTSREVAKNALYIIEGVLFDAKRRRQNCIACSSNCSLSRSGVHSICVKEDGQVTRKLEKSTRGWTTLRTFDYNTYAYMHNEEASVLSSTAVCYLLCKKHKLNDSKIWDVAGNESVREALRKKIEELEESILSSSGARKFMHRNMDFFSEVPTVRNENGTLLNVQFSDFSDTVIYARLTAKKGFVPLGDYFVEDKEFLFKKKVMLLLAQVLEEKSQSESIDVTKLPPIVRVEDMKRKAYLRDSENEKGSRVQRRWPGYPRVSYTTNLTIVRDAILRQETALLALVNSLISTERSWVFVEHSINDKYESLPRTEDEVTKWNSKMAVEYFADLEDVSGADVYLYPYIFLGRIEELLDASFQETLWKSTSSLYSRIVRRLLRENTKESISEKIEGFRGSTEDSPLILCSGVMRNETVSFLSVSDEFSIHLQRGDNALKKSMQAGVPIHLLQKGVRIKDGEIGISYVKCFYFAEFQNYTDDWLNVVRRYYVDALSHLLQTVQKKEETKRIIDVINSVSKKTSLQKLESRVRNHGEIEIIELENCFVLLSKDGEGFLVKESDPIFGASASASKEAKALLSSCKLRREEERRKDQHTRNFDLQRKLPSSRIRTKDAFYIIASDKNSIFIDLKGTEKDGKLETNVPTNSQVSLHVRGADGKVRTLVKDITFSRWPEYIPHVLINKGRNMLCRTSSLHETQEKALSECKYYDNSSISKTSFILIRKNIALLSNDADDTFYILKQRVIADGENSTKVRYSPMFHVSRDIPPNGPLLKWKVGLDALRELNFKIHLVSM